MCFLSCSLDSAPALSVPVLGTLCWVQEGLFWLLCPSPAAPGAPVTHCLVGELRAPTCPFPRGLHAHHRLLGFFSGRRASCSRAAPQVGNATGTRGFVPLVPPGAASPGFPRLPEPMLSSSPISSSFPGKGSIPRAGGTPAVEAAALIRRLPALSPRCAE